MVFEKITIANRALFERYIANVGENNCETAFINMLIWQGLYEVSYCTVEDTLLIKSIHANEEVFALPFGNLAEGMRYIFAYTGGKPPVFRAQEGPRLDRFAHIMGKQYDIVELAEDADYIYRKDDLAFLAGKKYHAKRNHISAFSRRFDWQYEPIDTHNRADVQRCAERWYDEIADRITQELATEREGIKMLLANFDTLGLLGGAIRADGHIVAFCIASFLNDDVVDVHVEKALADYEGAYAVVNNQFAKHLPDNIRYINREDDMGLDGLRKAKFSYHPATLLKKYLCLPRDAADKVRNIYVEAFGANPLFDGLFFHTYRKDVRTLVVDGKIVSILFLLPCSANGQRCYYLYAAATAENERGKGYMSRLIQDVLVASDAPLFLKPATDDLIPFYSKLGFHLAKGVAKNGDVTISVSDEHKRLSAMCDKCPDAFPIMVSVDPLDKTFEFPYIMQ